MRLDLISIAAAAATLVCAAASAQDAPIFAVRSDGPRSYALTHAACKYRQGWRVGYGAIGNTTFDACWRIHPAGPTITEQCMAYAGKLSNDGWFASTERFVDPSSMPRAARF